jgi:IPT/TIG domain-containing protein
MDLLTNLRRSGQRSLRILQALSISVSVAAICCLLSSCGGAASSGSPPTQTGYPPDFSLSAQPAILVIAPGGTQTAQVSVTGENGFSGSVQVTATPPSGLIVSPSSFTVSQAAPQQVTISAGSGVLPGTATLSFTGVSGLLSHTAQLQTEVELPLTSLHPPFRTGYRRTDLQYFQPYFPPHLTAYDSVHKRFFMSNTTLNAIDVFDGATESQIGSIVVPLPFGLDVSPDGSALYVAATYGDVYLIDPSTLSVLQRYPSATLGSQGYTANEPLILASGQLALLGRWGGIDGTITFAIWDPVTNNLQVVNPGFAIGQIALTSDRSKVVVGEADGGAWDIYDPSTGILLAESPPPGSGISSEILPTPDGTRLFLTYQNGLVAVYDSNTLAQLSTFTTGGTFAVLSYDGSTLFSSDPLGDVSAFDTTTFAQIGWVPNFNVTDIQPSNALSVIDETGLIVGPIGHGVAFLDSTQINAGSGQQTIFDLGFLSPGTGSPNGGTAVQAEMSEQNSAAPVNITSGTIYIGNGTASNVSVSNSSASGLAPPSTEAGAADFTVVVQDGSVQLNPENFSYGPTIVELSTNAASAEGGAQGVIFGYGLGQQPSDVTISVGGQPAPVTEVIPSASPIFPYPFPMEAVLFTIPAGTAGAASTVTVTTAAGSSSLPGSFYYVPAVQSYPLSGASLMQGVYDPTRAVVYFTDQIQIDVFSPATESWLAPIPVSFANAQSRLVGIALSPDGNTLAVSDAGNSKIYVMNPSSPSSVQSFSVNTGNGVQPYGLAVTNSQAVYYATYTQVISPPGGFNKLNTTTGKITTFELVNNGDAFVRVLLTPDGTSVFVNEGSGDAGVWVVDTSDDSITEGLQVTLAGDGNEDAALSGDGTVLLASDLLTDDNLNVFGDITYVDRDVWLPVAVYGQKLSSDGSLIFQPLTNGIDVHDSTSGLLDYRVQFPVQFANVYDALALDNTDNLIFGITSTGIVQIDLQSLPTPALYKKKGQVVSRMSHGRSIAPQGRNRVPNRPVFERPHLRHLAPAVQPTERR